MIPVNSAPASASFSNVVSRPKAVSSMVSSDHFLIPGPGHRPEARSFVNSEVPRRCILKCDAAATARDTDDGCKNGYSPIGQPLTSSRTPKPADVTGT